MREIKQLTTEAEIAEYVRLTANAYPGIKIESEADVERTRQRVAKQSEDPTITLYGAFEEKEMVGIMRCHDFTMKLLSTKIWVGGLGGVAVDLLYKKEKVALDMVLYFLRHYREQGACLTALYPFRPDFYRRMGYGYGTKINEYRLRPEAFPRGSKEHLVFLQADEKELLRDNYHRVLEQRNGLMEMSDSLLDAIFGNPGFRVVAYKVAGQVQGHLLFRFQPKEGGNFLRHDLEVRALVYENREALLALMTFLHTQADQVERVVIATQDEAFHFLVSDPRNGSDHLVPSVYHESNVQGVGIMYRVIDVPRLFEVLADHDFGGQTCRLRLDVADSLLPENGGETVWEFRNGRVHPLPPDSETDVTIRMDVAEFSSMITGAVTFQELYGYGLAQISDDAYLDRVTRLFYSPQKPWCMTPF